MSLHNIWKETLNKSFANAVQETFTLGLEQGLSRSDCVEKILSFAGGRWREVRDHTPRCVYEENDPRNGCQTDDYGTVIDPISLSEIPEERLIGFEENGKKWCFDIESLFEYIERGKPLNPMTREPLSKEVLLKIRSYKRRSKTVWITVHSDFHTGYTFSFTKGFSMCELVVEVFRYLSKEVHIPSIDLIQKYVVNITSLEELVDGPLEVVISPHDGIQFEKLANYYVALQQSLAKRFTLSSFKDAVEKAYLSSLREMTFFQSAKYLGGGDFEGFYRIMHPVITRSRKSIFTMTAEEFFVPLKELAGNEGMKPKSIGYDFFNKVIKPQGFDKLSYDKQSIWYTYQHNTVRYLLEASVTQKNLVKITKVTNYIRSMKSTVRLDLVESIIDAFSPKEAYDCLHGVVNWSSLKQTENKAFRDSIYYFMLFGLSEQEATFALKLVRSEVFIIDSSNIGRERLTEIVMTLDEPKYFHMLKDYLDMDKLYELAAKDECPKIKSAFTQRELLECRFRHGGDSTRLGLETQREYFQELITNGTDKINTFAFDDLLNSGGGLSSDEIYDYLLLTFEKSRMNIFCCILSSLAEAIFCLEEDDLSTDGYFSVVERLVKDETIPPEYKRLAYNAMMKTDLTGYDKLIQRLYQIIGFEESLQLYISTLTCVIPAPSFNVDDITLLMKSNPTLVSEIWTKGVETLSLANK